MVYKLEDRILFIHMFFSRKTMHDEQRKIVQVSRKQLIKGPCSRQRLEAMQYAASCTHHLRLGLFITMDFIHEKSLENIWPRLSDTEKRKTFHRIYDHWHPVSDVVP